MQATRFQGRLATAATSSAGASIGNCCAARLTNRSSALPSARSPLQQATPAPCQGRRESSTVCRVAFDASFKALLAQALERQSDEVVERIGVPGLTLDQCLDNNVLAWEPCIRLAIFVRENLPVAGKRVLELGSGTGVVGVTAAALGAHVTCTDLSESLPLMAHNLERNEGVFAAAGGSCNMRELNWDSPPQDLLNGPWDFIIGSDLVYCTESPGQLSVLLRELLARNPGAVVIISHKHRRQELDDNMERTFAAKGLSITELQRTDQDVPDADISIDRIAVM